MRSNLVLKNVEMRKPEVRCGPPCSDGRCTTSCLIGNHGPRQDGPAGRGRAARWQVDRRPRKVQTVSGGYRPVRGPRFKDADFTDNIVYGKLLSDKLPVNLGMVYENVVAQELTPTEGACSTTPGLSGDDPQLRDRLHRARQQEGQSRRGQVVELQDTRLVGRILRKVLLTRRQAVPRLAPRTWTGTAPVDCIPTYMSVFL